MQLVGAPGQFRLDRLYDASGTIATGGTAQLLLPEHKARSALYIINNSAGPLYVDFGGARATATISGGVVTGFTVTNVGQGYTLPPRVRCYGGGPVERNAMAGLGATAPMWPSPSNVATGLVVMSGSAPNKVVSSISVENGGAGYLQAPFVVLENAPGDANGVAVASAVGGAIPLLTQGSIVFWEGTVCPTDAVCIFGATTAQAFTCKFMY